MSWLLCGQIAALMAFAMILCVTAQGVMSDKNREDAVKRKEAGL